VRIDSLSDALGVEILVRLQYLFAWIQTSKDLEANQPHLIAVHMVSYTLPGQSGGEQRALLNHVQSR
jgi:hypothetical protein